MISVVVLSIYAFTGRDSSSGHVSFCGITVGVPDRKWKSRMFLPASTCGRRVRITVIPNSLTIIIPKSRMTTTGVVWFF